MAWVVDTCVLIDVAEADPSFGVASAQFLDLKRTEGLGICPVTYIELAPVFNGDEAAQNEFLSNLGVAWPEAWTLADTEEAYRAWQRHVSARRSGKSPKRPLADILIGAFAMRFDGILTRNGVDFQLVFPSLTILAP